MDGGPGGPAVVPAGSPTMSGAPTADAVPPATADAVEPAAGSIGGEPILPKPIVLGAVTIADIEAGLGTQRSAIDACYATRVATEPGLSGKVLVKFSIAHDGHVPDASVASTSLRDPATETCLVARVLATRFPPLVDGEVAIVRYPFTFPATSSR